MYTFKFDPKQPDERCPICRNHEYILITYHNGIYYVHTDEATLFKVGRYIHYYEIEPSKCLKSYSQVKEW